MSKSELISAILTAEGYFPPIDGTRLATAITGLSKALVVPPEEYLTPELVSEVASEAAEEPDAHVNIYYFRATEDIDEKLFSGRVTLRRVPFDLLRMDIA
jgi:hypothetical protein